MGIASVPRVAIKKCEDCNRLCVADEGNLMRHIVRRQCSCDGMGHFTALYWELND